MVIPSCSPPKARAQDRDFVRQCSFAGLQPRLPLRWPTPPDLPDSPKKRYRSYYVYLGYIALADTWLNLTTLARLVQEATFAAEGASG